VTNDKNPYDVLGISHSSPRDEVEAAHKRLAHSFHPDRYATAPTPVREEAERRMSEINAARDRIARGDTYGRPASEKEYQRASEAAARFVGNSCLLCGHAPSETVTLKTSVGKILWRELRMWEGELCRSCGLSLFRDTQNETLLKGWWGLISFFANLLYIGQNWLAYSRIVRLKQPFPTPLAGFTPLSAPLAAGRPLFQRAGVWLSALLLFVIVGSILPRDSSYELLATDVQIGDCFAIDAIAEGTEFENFTIVDCNGSGEVGEIFALPEYLVHPDVDSFVGEEALSSFGNDSCLKESEYDWSFFIPSKAAWEQGFHRVWCYYPLDSG